MPVSPHIFALSQCVCYYEEVKGTNMKYHSVPAFYDTSKKLVHLFKIILGAGLTLAPTDIMRPQVCIL